MDIGWHAYLLFRRKATFRARRNYAYAGLK